jgi:hypothetical protein
VRRQPRLDVHVRRVVLDGEPQQLLKIHAGPLLRKER